MDNATAPSAPTTFGAPQAPSTIDRLLTQAQSQPQVRKYHEFEVPDSMPIEMRELVVTGAGRCALVRLHMKLLSYGEERDVYKRSAQLNSDAVMGIMETIEALSFVTVAPIRPTMVAVVDEHGRPILDPAGQPVRQTVDAPATAEEFEFSVRMQDGSAEGLYAGLHPGMRKLIIAGYVAETSPDSLSMALFVKSRKTVTR